mgnify:FL=1
MFPELLCSPAKPLLAIKQLKISSNSLMKFLTLLTTMLLQTIFLRLFSYQTTMYQTLKLSFQLLISVNIFQLQELKLQELQTWNSLWMEVSLLELWMEPMSKFMKKLGPKTSLFLVPESNKSMNLKKLCPPQVLTNIFHLNFKKFSKPFERECSEKEILSWKLSQPFQTIMIGIFLALIFQLIFNSKKR